MKKIIEIASIMYAFVYLLIFDYLFGFISLYGFTTIILFAIVFCGITKVIMKKYLYIIPIILFSGNLILILFYVPYLWLVILNIIIGIVYLSQYFKILRQ